MINQQLRRTGLGGSEIGVLFGVDPYRDEFSLWLDKRGDLPPAEPSGRMIVGKYLERGILDLYAYQTGRKLDYCDETMLHPERPWQIYTADALCRDEQRGVDAKCVSWDQRSHWGAGLDVVPDHYQFQAMWYMSAFDYEHWDIAAFFGSDMPRIYEIVRDREAERIILARAEQWWRKYIVGDEQPPIDGSSEASVWLKQMYPAHRPSSIRTAEPAECDLLDHYVSTVIELKQLSGKRKRLENQIKKAIGNDEGLRWEGGRLTWRRSRDSARIDWRALAEALLGVYVRDADADRVIRREYTKQRAGSRRMYLDSERYRDAVNQSNDDDNESEDES